MHLPKVARMRPSIRGIYAPVVTPFKAQQVDLDALGSNLIRYRDTPLAGVVILGSNGEAVMLDDDESDAVLAAARRAWPAGTCADRGDRTRVDCRDDCGHPAGGRCRRRRRDGAHAVVLQGATSRATASSGTTKRWPTTRRCPILLYNVTMFTGVSLPVEAAVRLAKHERIIGLKDSGSDSRAPR